MSIRKRLREYIALKGISLRELERQCQISNGVLGRLNESTTPKTLTRLQENSDLNIDWLMTGEGEMLNQTIGDAKENFEGCREDKESERLIPFYDVETTGGYNGVVSDSSEGALVGYIQPGGWFDGRETAAIRHVGDSMTEYPNGCILAVKKVYDRHLLVFGKNYVIETLEYRITKRVQKGSTNNTITLYSTNTEKYEDGRLVHEPFEVELDDIINIYSILGYIVNQSGEMKLIRTR
ncbi:MAG: helix-turn-helix transcriptional regulator [Bacteroidales bacterium]|nr:helix-turn-helix transcriptional regulator [Bacteroidales bacterium]